MRGADMPSFQGELDGLCGPYAIVNAFEECGLADDGEAIFKACCKALSAARWPALMWEGTSFGDLQRMIRACLDDPDIATHVEVSYPFSRDPPTTNDDYWWRFDEVFSDETAVCAIIGITQPRLHWIVAGWDGGRVIFFDSDARTPRHRKNRASLFAGKRREKPHQWLIERHELIVFRNA